MFVVFLIQFGSCIRPGKPKPAYNIVLLGREEAGKETIAHRILSEDNPEDINEKKDVRNIKYVYMYVCARVTKGTFRRDFH